MTKEEFLVLIEKARKNARGEDDLEEMLSEFDAIERDTGNFGDETRFKIPYVSAKSVCEAPWS